MTTDEIMELADKYWHSFELACETWISTRKQLRSAVEQLVLERDEARASDGWQWTESARKDRAAALSQWVKAAKERDEMRALLTEARHFVEGDHWGMNADLLAKIDKAIGNQRSLS